MPQAALAPIGRAFQVTAGMIRSDNADEYIRQHHYDMILRGRTGDWFKVSWSGTEPISWSRTADAGYETSYGTGLKN